MITGEVAAELRRRCAELGREVGLFEGRGFEVPWDRVEAAMGIRLPLSYKVFIEYFGPGRFGEEVCYYIPGIENSAYELLYCVLPEADAPSPEPGPVGDLTYGVYPVPGGLLNFGWLPEDLLFWDTSTGDPDDWPIVIPSLHVWVLPYPGDLIAFIGDLLIEAPAIGDVEYDPTLIRGFVADDGRHPGGRGPVLQPYSAFRGA